MLRFVIPYACMLSQQLCKEIISYLWCIIRCQLCSMHVYDRFCFLVGCFSIYLLAFICTKRKYCLCIQNPQTQVVPNESTISTYMRYFHAVLSKFACANSNFQNNFSVLCSRTAHEAAGGGQYFPCQVCYSHDECLFTFHCTREWLVIGMPSPTMNQKLITTKFLGKCWYGGHPWIRLAMDCERMVERK